MKTMFLIITTLAVVFGTGSYSYGLTPEESLGQLLYNDKNLSNPPGQSCATCHLWSAGFAEPDSQMPVSQGKIRGRFGTRNSPSAAYASFSPAFFFDAAEGLWMGGQFWDGRASTLEDQAKGPFLNPLEMNNTKLGVIEAIRQAAYEAQFISVYGDGSLDDVETAYNLVAQAIAAFERTKNLNRFTSKFDYYRRGKVALTARELQGLQLFEDPAKGNCAACHPTTSADNKPVLTDFSYDNLGVPKNTEIEYLTGGPVPVDLGLGVTVNDPAENGKFKVSSLRNVGKTAPYAHNGYFKTLKEIVHFYNTRDVDASWPAPEVPETVNTSELGNLGLTSQEEDAIVAFLMTLSDGYYCVACQPAP